MQASGETPGEHGHGEEHRQDDNVLRRGELDGEPRRHHVKVVEHEGRAGREIGRIGAIADRRQHHAQQENHRQLVGAQHPVQDLRQGSGQQHDQERRSKGARLRQGVLEREPVCRRLAGRPGLKDARLVHGSMAPMRAQPFNLSSHT